MQRFPKNSRVIFIGDSITAGCEYPTRVVEYYNKHLPELNVKFAVGAAAGSTYDDALKFFEAHVLPFAPTHATVYFGVNDAHLSSLDSEDKDQRRSEVELYYEKYKNNIETYLDLLITHGITPILITPSPYAEYLDCDTKSHKHAHRLIYEYAEAVREAAYRRRLDVIDIHARMCELYLIEDIYTTDRVHPNELGLYRIAEYILRAQGLKIDDYRPIEAIITEEYMGKWFGCVRPLSLIYTTYVCVPTDIYHKPAEEQIHIMIEYLAEKKYGDVDVRRELTETFLKYKPMEAELREKLAAL